MISDIFVRKDRKIEKLKKEKEEGEEEPLAEGGKVEEVSPEGKNVIKEEVERVTDPILQTVRTQADEQELQDVITKYPNAKSMEQDIRKYMEHSAYKDVSVEFIFLGLAAKQGKLATGKTEAEKEAEESKMGGHGRRATEEGEFPDVSKMTDKEMDDLVFKAKTGQL